MSTMKAKKKGLKARFHDHDLVAAKFKPDMVEFHLSDKDTQASWTPTQKWDHEVYLHMPEYWDGKLIDPANEDYSRRRDSIDILHRVVEIAQSLKPFFKGEPKIVLHPGGMSIKPVKENRWMLDNLVDTLGRLDTKGIEVLPENMPPYPWFHGGQWHSNILCDPKECLWISEITGMTLTYDISHAGLWCNESGMDLVEFTQIIAPKTSHIHIADATGTDGEGVQIDEGEVDFKGVMEKLNDFEGFVVPEIWYGHKNEGEGFGVAFDRLAQYFDWSENSAPVIMDGSCGFGCNEPGHSH